MTEQGVNFLFAETHLIPFSFLKVLCEIVSRIERERFIVEGNCELIRIYEEKVKKVIELVWEG